MTPLEPSVPRCATADPDRAGAEGLGGTLRLAWVRRSRMIASIVVAIKTPRRASMPTHAFHLLPGWTLDRLRSGEVRPRGQTNPRTDDERLAGQTTRQPN